jgi:hypothetical protein
LGGAGEGAVDRRPFGPTTRSRYTQPKTPLAANSYDSKLTSVRPVRVLVPRKVSVPGPPLAVRVEMVAEFMNPAFMPGDPDHLRLRNAARNVCA